MTRRSFLAVLALVAVALGGAVVGRVTATSPRTVNVSAQPGPVDIGFAQAMAEHHGQALIMADDALAHGDRPEVRTLAHSILVTQGAERGTLTGWLALWHAPQLAGADPMAWMQSASMSTMRMSDGDMPGLADQQQLDRLARTRGAAFDRLFLQLMIRHHQGGILMARCAVAHARLPEVRSLAASVVIDQTQESGVMQQLLRSLPS